MVDTTEFALPEGTDQVRVQETRQRMAEALLASTESAAQQALEKGNRGRAIDAWRALRDATASRKGWEDLHRQAEERIQALKPPVSRRAVVIGGAVILLFAIIILLLTGAFAVVRQCRAEDPADFCQKLPGPVLLALVGPTPTASPTPTITPTPSPTYTPAPTASPTPTSTPTPSPTPTEAAIAPPAECEFGFVGQDGALEVLAEEPVDVQPVVGNPNLFEAVWHLRPARVSGACPELGTFGYQVRPIVVERLPFQMEGHEFRLQRMEGGLFEAQVVFHVLAPGDEEQGGENEFELHYLTDPEHPELAEAYRRVPLLALRLEWHLRPAVTPTPTPTPTHTPTYTPMPRPTRRPTRVTPTPVPLTAPILTSPNEGDSAQEWVTFEWEWDRRLGPHRLFDVRVRRENGEAAEYKGVANPVKEQTLTVNFKGLVEDKAHWNRWAAGGEVEPGGELWWSVAVVDGRGATLVESSRWRLVYSPDSGGGGSGCICANVNCRACSCAEKCCKKCCQRCKE